MIRRPPSSTLFPTLRSSDPPRPVHHAAALIVKRAGRRTARRQLQPRPAGKGETGRAHACTLDTPLARLPTYACVDVKEEAAAVGRCAGADGPAEGAGVVKAI